MEIIRTLLSALLTWQMLLAMVVGVCGGTIIGALPGMSASMGIALLLPLTYGMEPVAALVMLTSIYTTAIYGGSISAILLHTPGTPSSAATAMDGYAMTVSGRGYQALGLSTVSSGIGGFISGIALLTIAPWLSELSLKFSAGEYFWIGIFGLTIIAAISPDHLIKGCASGALGLMVACIGADVMTGYARFTFGNKWLQAGISTVPALIGLFSSSQVFLQVETIFNPKVEKVESVLQGRFLPTRKEFIGYLPTIVKSTIIGIFVGILPGAGGDVASWVAYNEAKRSSKHPETFGHGEPLGVVASETANNAVTGGALIPMLTLGIPGSAAAAILMGGLMIQGMQPGRELFTTGAMTTYSIITGFILANILMCFFGYLICRKMVNVTKVSQVILNAVIVVLSVVGSYAINRRMFDVYIMIIFGVIGYIMRKANYSNAAIVLALVLGATCEKGYRQASVMASIKFPNVWAYFLTRPICVGLMILCIFSVAFPVIQKKVKKIKAAKEAAR